MARDNVAGTRSSWMMRYIHTVANPGERIIWPNEGVWLMV